MIGRSGPSALPFVAYQDWTKRREKMMLKEKREQRECGRRPKEERGEPVQDGTEDDWERVRERMEGREGSEVPEEEIDRPGEERVERGGQRRPSLSQSNLGQTRLTAVYLQLDILQYRLIVLFLLLFLILASEICTTKKKRSTEVNQE